MIITQMRMNGRLDYFEEIKANVHYKNIYISHVNNNSYPLFFVCASNCKFSCLQCIHWSYIVTTLI